MKQAPILKPGDKVFVIKSSVVDFPKHLIGTIQNYRVQVRSINGEHDWIDLDMDSPYLSYNDGEWRPVKFTDYLNQAEKCI